MAKKKATNELIVKTFLATALLALPLGYLVGSAVASTDDTDTTESASMQDDHAHDTDDDMQTSHAHETLEVAAASAPQIDSLEVTKDPKSGWNLHMHTGNFSFTPESASGDHVAGQGHAHLYVDGKKITRLYSGDYYVGELDEGAHTIRVTLNTNDHKDYAVDGRVIAAEQTIVDMHHTDDADDSHSNDDNHSH